MSYNKSAADCLVSLLARSTAFRTLVGAGSEAAARGFIVQDDGGDGDLGTAADGTSTLNGTQSYAVTRLDDTQRERRALGTYGWSGSAEIALWIKNPDPELSAPAMMSRARDTAGDIAEQIEAQAFGTDTFGTIEVTTNPPAVAEDATPSRAGYYLVLLDLNLGDLP